jgi:sortase A
MKKKILSNLLIVLGVSIILYPFANQVYQNRAQEKLMKQWNSSLSSIDAGAPEIFIEENYLEEDYNTQEAQEGESKDDAVKDEMSGVIDIQAINLRLPILIGASDKNLNISVASLKEGSLPGEVGNFIVAGHRSHSYGKLFNRLDEVSVGDIIKISDMANEYEYKISDKFYVLPEEIWVLESKNTKEITLITCHPMVNPTHRLIVKGEIIE